MRFTLGLLAVLFAPSSLFAQQDVVRGCVTLHAQGVVLRALDAGRQHFDSQNLVDGGEGLLLLADDDLLDEIVLREGQEIEVTGRINPTPPRAIAEPPILPPPGGGNFPGAGRPVDHRGGRPFNPGVSIRRGRRGPAVENVIAVEDYRALRPECRRPIASDLDTLRQTLHAMTAEKQSVAAADDRINRLVLDAHPDAQAVYRFGTWGTASERPEATSMLPCSCRTARRCA